MMEKLRKQRRESLIKQNEEKKLKIALFFPWIKSRGGAERVILELLKNSKQKIDVYTWVYNKENSFDEFKEFKINVIAPKTAEKISRFYILRGLFFPISLFSKIPLERYDLFLIYGSGMEELTTFRNYLPKKTYAYINTPLRAACKEIVEWDLKQRYKNPVSKFLYLVSIKIYKLLEKLAWKKIDKAIFISELSLERAREHGLLKNKKTEIIYPPVDVEKFKRIKAKKGNYFLYVSRFNEPKRQDLLIESWKLFVKNHPNKKLILAGSIENKKYFKKIKKIADETKNVEIKTNLKDKEILELYANCLAVIFIPFIEDFGIVPFEALSAGKPLIAVDKGGYVKLIEKIPQFFKIRELQSKKLMVEEINKVLERFLKSKIKAKRVIIKETSIQNFIKRFEEALIK